MIEAKRSTEWIAAALAGDRASLARMLSVVENHEPEFGAVLREIQGRLGGAMRIGFTGAPGVGKSTLVGTYIDELRRRGKTVGVIAVDPSSATTGGAVLGDRVRMTQKSEDPGVFIRSIATRGQLGGVAISAMLCADVLDAAGRDVVVIETVGTGQSEIDVAEISHCTVLVCAPNAGDDIQGVKAGVLEVADVLVLNKSDLASAETAARQLRRYAHFGALGRESVPIVCTVATTSQGVPELADILEVRAGARRAASLSTTLLVLRRCAVGVLEHWMSTSSSDLNILVDEIENGRLNFDRAAREIVRRACSTGDS